ncbi:hypothetical protein GGF46_002456 [Coemansia sp. RSA 552]|nr:hypothetical protein GGF46_002456 [Coemansia sp. RSA 552]
MLSLALSTVLGSAVLAGAQSASNIVTVSSQVWTPTEEAEVPIETLDTVFTGDTDTDMQHEGELAEIYCPDRDCSMHREWLAYRPSQALAWTLGVISFVIAILTFRFGYRGSPKAFFMALPPSGTAMALLGVCLFLRASLTLPTGNKRSIQVASMLFNYVAGTTLCSALHANLLPLKTRYQPPTSAEKNIAMVLRNLAFWTPAVLFIVGVIYSFNLQTSYSEESGAHCIQAALVLLCCVVLSVLVFLALRAKAAVRALPKRRVGSALLFAVMLLLWAAFMLGRSFVEMDNVTRHSEVLFTLLNYAPLVICGAAALVLGEPLEPEQDEPVTDAGVQTEAQTEAQTDVQVEVKESREPLELPTLRTIEEA